MSDTVPGWPIAFRGSLAVAAGLVTPDRLRGRAFRRLLPDIYGRAGDDPPDLLVRSLAAYRLVEGRGVLAGYSAALLLDADCAPQPHVPAEVIVPGGRKPLPGVIVRRDKIAPRESCPVGDVRVTTPLRTAYDLGRRGELVDRVVAVDRLANRHRFHPDLLLNFARHYRRGRGSELICETLAYACCYSGSPMETRLRLLIVDAGLPTPQVQWVVQDPVARTAVWLDLAWPEIMVGIEYEGEVHGTAQARRLDTRRYTALVDKGWKIYRYTGDEVLGTPDKIIAELSRARARVRWP